MIQNNCNSCGQPMPTSKLYECDVDDCENKWHMDSENGGAILIYRYYDGKTTSHLCRVHYLEITRYLKLRSVAEYPSSNS